MKTEYVLGFMFSPDKTAVVLIEKKRPAWQAGKLNGVGGKLEQNEWPVDAMVREFKEETGCTTLPADWKYFLTLEGGDWRVYCYRAAPPLEVPIPTQSPTDEKVAWWSIGSRNQAMSSLTIPNLNWLIPMALDEDNLCGAITYMDEKFLEQAKEFVPKL
jgi:8-oxo-dGTP diphosphatase